jgi:hypothetical protein
LGFLLEAFTFGFWAFDFLMWEALEGKELLKGKGLLKGENELLKGKCWRRIANGELLASLRAET